MFECDDRGHAKYSLYIPQKQSNRMFEVIGITRNVLSWFVCGFSP